MPDKTLRRYLSQLWEDHLRHAVPWARDAVLLGAAMVLTPLVVARVVYGKAYFSGIDLRLIKPTLWVYLALLISYGSFQFVRAAWKSDVALREKLSEAERAFEEMVQQKDQEFTSMVNMKTGELKTFQEESTAQYSAMLRGKDEERKSVEQTLEQYKLVWTVLQFRTGTLAKELRIYCEETVAPEPFPPPINGESEADLLERKCKLMQPWMDKITYEYNQAFAQRVGYLRDYFAAQGYEDSSLNYRINTAVVHTEQVREIADRLMGLALRELAKRQLRTLTLKQLCCD